MSHCCVNFEALQRCLYIDLPCVWSLSFRMRLISYRNIKYMRHMHMHMHMLTILCELHN